VFSGKDEHRFLSDEVQISTWETVRRGDKYGVWGGHGGSPGGKLDHTLLGLYRFKEEQGGSQQMGNGEEIILR
jgi:hypothetical protein